MKIVRMLSLFTVLFMMASCSVPQSSSSGLNGTEIGFDESLVLNRKYAGNWKKFGTNTWFAVHFYKDGNQFWLKEGQGNTKDEALKNLGKPEKATVDEKTGEIFMSSPGGAPVGWKYYIKDGGRKIDKYTAVYPPGSNVFNPTFLYDGTMDLVN